MPSLKIIKLNGCSPSGHTTLKKKDVAQLTDDSVFLVASVLVSFHSWTTNNTTRASTVMRLDDVQVDSKLCAMETVTCWVYTRTVWKGKQVGLVYVPVVVHKNQLGRKDSTIYSRTPREDSKYRSGHWH